MGVRRRKEEKKVEDESEDTEFTVRKSPRCSIYTIMYMFLLCCAIRFGSCVLVIAALWLPLSLSQTWREEVQADQERRLII